MNAERARARKLTEMIAVRFTPEQMTWLRECAEEEGRTIAQTIRHILAIAIERGPYR